MTKQIEPVKFGAPWGSLLKITSTVLVCVLGSVSIGSWAYLPRTVPAFAYWSAVGMPLVILVGSIPFAVRGYVIYPGVLVIRRLGWSTRISLMGLQSVEPNPDAMRRAVRLLGNGGGFVIAGLFRSRDLGLFRAYVNDLTRTVVLRFPGRRVVVSPADPTGFAEALKRAANPGFE